jgi:hypothetical protein
MSIGDLSNAGNLNEKLVLLLLTCDCEKPTCTQTIANKMKNVLFIQILLSAAKIFAIIVYQR